MTAQTLMEAGKRAGDQRLGAILCQKAGIVAQREQGVSVLEPTMDELRMQAFNLQYWRENGAGLAVVGGRA
jgi:hypothetical protein